jgi:hypothetical protein
MRPTAAPAITRMAQIAPVRRLGFVPDGCLALRRSQCGLCWLEQIIDGCIALDIIILAHKHSQLGYYN